MPMLKFQGKFKKGQRIRAFDFPPRTDCGHCYVEGIIFNECYRQTEKGMPLGYEIRVTKDVFDGEEIKDGTGRLDEIVLVPFEVSLLEWDDRICLTEEQEAVYG